MRLIAFLLPTALFMSALAGGCSSDNLEDLRKIPIGGAPCDTTAVPTYRLVVSPIIDRYDCRSANCHVTGGTGTLATGFNYETVAGLQAAVANGRLVRAIEHSGPVNTHMPQAPRAKMDACDILAVKRWVRAGAKND